MKRPACTIVLLLIGTCLADENLPDLDTVLQSVTGLPGLENLNTSVVPSLEKATDLFQKKCTKNGGADAYERANKGKDVLLDCLHGLINITELQKEMEEAKPNGELDTVFKKYCARTPDLKRCIENFTVSFEPCLEPKEQENVKIIMNITDALLDFTCFKEGDRIALFISAEGPECFQDKRNDIQQCINSTFGGYAPGASISDASSGFTDIQSLPSLLFGLKECQDIENLQNCSVKKLESCSDPTPANIVESLFDFIKKSTPCDGLLKEAKALARISESADSSAQIIYSSFVTVLMLISVRLI